MSDKLGPDEGIRKSGPEGEIKEPDTEGHKRFLRGPEGAVDEPGPDEAVREKYGPEGAADEPGPEEGFKFH